MTQPKVPLPDYAESTVVVEPPGQGPGSWVGSPSALRDGDIYYLAYRVRHPVDAGRGVSNVIARSHDGVAFETVTEVGKDVFGGESLERPGLVRVDANRWRLYVSIATPGTKHWRVDVVEAATPERLGDATARTVLPGDETIAVKDPVVRHFAGGWHLWASCHPLTEPGEEDRMTTWYATSVDGLEWTWRGTALDVRPGEWDARGARVTSVGVVGETVWATYDGRASEAENFDERTGVAFGRIEADGTCGPLVATDGKPLSSPHGGGSLRYLEAVPLTDGRHRLYFEAARPDDSHDLRTQVV